MQLFATDSIQSIRNDLYSGSGYHVIRGFLPATAVDHIREFWTTRVTNGHSGYFDKYVHLRLNGPDLSLLSRDQDTHHNFFWNRPRDVATSSAAWQMQTLRNEIEGNAPDRGFLPHYPTPGERAPLRYAASYRVVFTRNAGEVKPHCDWALDHSKVQMCLILTSPGRDYDSGGIVIDDRFRGGSPVIICEHENLQAGDLLLFRYAHRHGVAPVVSSAGGKGYGRMILPEELIDLRDRWLLNRAWKRGLSTVSRAKTKLPAAIGGAKDGKSLVFHQLKPLRRQGEELHYDDEVGHLMQIAIREGVDPSLVYGHRGLWGRFRLHQDWQVSTLKKHGLQPHHHFLDIGCGMLRLGMPLVPFLDDDRYCGVDALKSYIRLGQVYMRDVVRCDKSFHVLADSDFGFQQFGRKFNFAMAQSVFTHLSYQQIEHCLTKLKEVMQPGGRLLFTVILNANKEFSFMYSSDTPVTKSSHEDLTFYQDLGRKIGFDLRLLGSEGHGSQQACLATF